METLHLKSEEMKEKQHSEDESGEAEVALTEN